VGGGTALSHTLHQGLFDMADLLLQHGVDINERDKVRRIRFLNDFATHQMNRYSCV